MRLIFNNYFKAGWGLISLLVLVNPTMAADFMPTTAAQLQTDLTTAAANGQPDTITLPAGSFNTADNGNNPFTFSGTDNNPLTIQGGGAGITILDTNPDMPAPLLIINTGSPDGSADVSINGITFQNSPFGLMVTSDAANLMVKDCDFISNGTAINSMANSGSVLAERNTFSNSLFGGAQSSSSSGEINYSDNLFQDNFLSGGPGVLAIFGANLTFNADMNRFINNSSSSSSGIVAIHNGQTNLTGNLFLNNSSTGGTGAVQLSGNNELVMVDNILAGNSGTSGGGVFAVYLSSAIFTNNTVTENSSLSLSGGFFLIPANATTTTEFYNNIVFNNQLGFFSTQGEDIFITDNSGSAMDGSPVILSHSDIGDFSSACENDTTTPCTPEITRTSLINEDPDFIDPDNDNFNLLAGSPCIGTGLDGAPEIPTEDFNQKPLNSPPDMGALAAQSGIVVNPTTINFGNVVVGVGDFATFEITNNGSVPLDVTGLTLSDTNNFSLNMTSPADACGGTAFALAAGDTCTGQVNFGPSGEGAVSGTLTVDSDNNDNPSVLLNLNGIGVLVDNGGCSLGNGLSSTGCLAFLWILPGIAWLRCRRGR